MSAPALFLVGPRIPETRPAPGREIRNEITNPGMAPGLHRPSGMSLRILAVLGALTVFGCGLSPVSENRSLSDAGAGEGDGGSQVDAGSDAGTDGGYPACVDPAVAAKLPACQAATTQADCTAAGGTWGRFGMAPMDSCSCPTGWGACTCTRSSDCGGAMCSAPLAGGAGSNCAATVGACVKRTPTFGCLCVFETDGVAHGLCID